MGALLVTPSALLLRQNMYSTDFGSPSAAGHVHGTTSSQSQYAVFESVVDLRVWTIQLLLPPAHLYSHAPFRIGSGPRSFC
ncbi:Protein of unknown function [Pyronema omphalodes CBS 100304]|uniref:Uncharacterized protein n=1 Tax=Pyronema omphalodes (strain CBS 100304) TaxID=1076935 RepID=U4LVX1_PYROM|nr:Protein of unknown function [Pyronema omphalodes CBS 100304]